MSRCSEVLVLRSLWRSILVALVAAVVSVPTVVAHAALESATPGPDDELVGSPSELITQFSQDLDPSRTVLEVRDAAGTRVARGGGPGDGRREFRLALPELAPGAYEVRWTSFSSEDGELARDKYVFSVAAVPSPTLSPTPSPSSRPSPTPSASPAATATIPVAPEPSTDVVPPAAPASALETAAPIAATALFVAAVAIWMLRRRRA